MMKFVKGLAITAAAAGAGLGVAAGIEKVKPGINPWLRVGIAVGTAGVVGGIGCYIAF